MSSKCDNDLKGHCGRDSDAASIPAVTAPPGSQLVPAAGEGSPFEDSMLWYKEWANSDTDPKMVSAGFWGAEVFRCLCRISAEFDLGGRVPLEYRTEEYLFHRLRATDETLRNGVKQGLVSCVAVGLAMVDGDAFVLDNWETRQASTSTERVRAFREKKRDETDETFRNVSVTQSRSDKRRSNKSAVADPRFQSVVDLWSQKYEKTKGAKYESANWGMEGKALKTLLKATVATLEEFGARMDLALADKWFATNTPTLSAFCRSWPRFVPPPPKPKPILITDPSQLEDFQ